MLLGVTLLLRNPTFHSAIRTGQIQMYFHEGYKILKRLVHTVYPVYILSFPFISKKYFQKNMNLRNVEI